MYYGSCVRLYTRRTKRHITRRTVRRTWPRCIMCLVPVFVPGLTQRSTCARLYTRRTEALGKRTRESSCKLTQIPKSRKFDAYSVDLRSTCIDMRWVAKRRRLASPFGRRLMHNRTQKALLAYVRPDGLYITSKNGQCFLLIHPLPQRFLQTRFQETKFF